MNWNYRVMKREISEDVFEYGIYEVYYDDDGAVSSWTENSMTPTVDSPEGLREELEIMKKAFDLDVLDYLKD